MSREIGRRIRALRRLKRYTQQELSKQLGISVSMLSNIERGVQTARPALLEEIADVLEVPPEELFLVSGDLKKYSLM